LRPVTTGSLRSRNRFARSSASARSAPASRRRNEGRPMAPARAGRDVSVRRMHTGRSPGVDVLDRTPRRSWHLVKPLQIMGSRTIRWTSSWSGKRSGTRYPSTCQGGPARARIPPPDRRDRPLSRVAILDLPSRQSTGRRCSGALRQHPSCAHIPVIIITSSDPPNRRIARRQPLLPKAQRLRRLHGTRRHRSHRHRTTPPKPIPRLPSLHEERPKHVR